MPYPAPELRASPWPLPWPRRHAVALGHVALVVVWVLLLAGCDIRDEMPRPTRSNTLLGTGGPPTGGGGRVIEFLGGYEAGRQRAAGEDRPLLLVCTANWCRFSAEMTQRTLRDPRLVAMSRRAVCVLLDADRDADACRTLHVSAFPTLIVLSATGEERYRSTGRAAPHALADALERAFDPQRVASAPDDEPVR